MTSTRQCRRWIARGVACAVACGTVASTVFLSATTSAQRPITVELNKLEDREDACRASFVIGNGGERFDIFVLDLIVFDSDQVIAKHLAVNAAPLRSDKTSVKMFDIVGIGCADIGRILLNDVSKCESRNGARLDCIDLVAISSRAASDFVK